MSWTTEWVGSIAIVESAPSGGSVGDLDGLVSSDGDVVVIVCHGTVHADTELEIPANRVVLAVSGELRDGALALARQSALILATEGATFVDNGRDHGTSFAAALVDRLSVGEVARMSLTREPLGASDAERLGLIDRILPDASLRQEAISAAHLIAEVDDC